MRREQLIENLVNFICLPFTGAAVLIIPQSSRLTNEQTQKAGVSRSEHALITQYGPNVYLYIPTGAIVTADLTEQGVTTALEVEDGGLKDKQVKFKFGEMEQTISSTKENFPLPNSKTKILYLGAKLNSVALGQLYIGLRQKRANDLAK